MAELVEVTMGTLVLTRAKRLVLIGVVVGEAIGKVEETFCTWPVNEEKFEGISYVANIAAISAAAWIEADVAVAP